MAKGGFHNPFKGLGKVRTEAASEQSASPLKKPRPAATRHPAPKQSPGDEATFMAAMHGVSALENRERIEPPKQETMRSDDEEAIALEEFRSFASGQGAFNMEDSGEQVIGRAPGVSNLLLKELAAGRYAYQRHLDLHGYRREPAREALIRFVAQAREETGFAAFWS